MKLTNPEWLEITQHLAAAGAVRCTQEKRLRIEPLPVRHDLAAGDALGDDSERPEQWPQWRRDYHAQRVSEARWVAVGLGVGILAVAAIGFLTGWLVEVCR